MIKLLRRWNQLNQLEDTQHTVGSSFSHSPVTGPETHERVVQRIPLVDINEDAQGYLITAELPEVKKENVNITMDHDGTLIISGDRKFEENRKKDHCAECVYGRFLYRFLLPADARPAKISVEFKDGVLQLRLAKNEKAKLQQVEVGVAAYDRVPNHLYSSSTVGPVGKVEAQTVRNRNKKLKSSCHKL